MNNKILFTLPAALVLSLGVAHAELAERQEVRGFIERMVQQHGFEERALAELFDQVELRSDIVAAISRPAESKPWHQYRPIFLTEERIRGGVAFWDQHAELLERAEKEYRIPAAVIVAILGVETRYGRFAGNYRVMDSLSTLAFDYPPRSSFFASQLESFLITAREEQVDPLTLKGSYAGAMGQPQFIPSSFRGYAVDFDGDGRRDIWGNPADVIGSVANYFRRHGWRWGEPVAARAEVTVERAAPLLEQGYRPSVPVSKLVEYGVKPRRAFAADAMAGLIALETKSGGPEHWVVLDNFYVITRYNHSALYAMAVYQLSEAIRTARAESLRNQRTDGG